MKLKMFKSKIRMLFSDRRKAAVITGCATAILVVALCFALSDTNQPSSALDGNANGAPSIADSRSSVFEANSKEANLSSSSNSSKATGMGNPAPETQDNATNSNATTPPNNGKGISSNEEAGDRQSDPAKEPSTSSQPGNPQKTWVEDTEKVWVVDKAAWTETIPVYENVERSICNVCGADITGNTSAHNKQHMLAGEGSGYHSEVRQVKVGEETVEHPEEGHWETLGVGGRWENK
ncbi:hypothetical protein [Enteroscipio rubneri]|uniref:Uncharacterized protein n=1 Tax=Enteroscipio rubneri TaxID=2070686 RepID=A0A2K2U913_9ACTN|nr:hypothetical protein [Enteroscipio rubneri]PNV66774.1 hypothetical protein C2L71_11270 [Enteroscipio rubneri]